MTDWPAIIRELLEQHRLSDRRFCALTGLCRTTVRRSLSGETSFDIEMLEKALKLFGYELDAVKVRDVEFARRPVRRKIREKVDPPPPRPTTKRRKLIAYAGCDPSEQNGKLRLFRKVRA